MTPQQEQFLRSVCGPALELERQNPIPPACVTVAQAILETGWGKASIGFNLWGIKYSAADPKRQSWGFDELPTMEVYNQAELDAARARGVKIYKIENRADGLSDVTILDKFQKFPSAIEAIRCHNQIFAGSYYLRARAALSITGWRGFAQALGPQIDPNTGKPVPSQTPTYSTSPEYGATIEKIVDELSLDDPIVLQSYADGPEVGGAE